MPPAPPSVHMSDSDFDDDQNVEEDEEEEVEIEEEEEEEEEESEHQEDYNIEEEQEEEDPSEAGDDHKDVRQDVMSEEHFEQELGSSAQGKLGGVLPSNAFDIEQSGVSSKLYGPLKEPLNIQSEKLFIKSGQHLALGENNGILLENKKDPQILAEKNSSHCSEYHSNSNYHLGKSEIVIAKTSNLSCVTGKDAVVATRISDCFGREANDVLDFEDEIKQKDKWSGDDKKKRASRLASEMGAQSLSSGVGIDDGKRLAIICNFFAKGWCIKGSSCRFLHRKDNLSSTLAQHEGQVAVNRREVQLNEGVRDDTERPRSPSIHEPISNLVGINSAVSLHLGSEGIKKLEQIESERSNRILEEHDCLSLHKEILSAGSSLDAKQVASSSGYPGIPPLFKDVERESKRHNWPANDCSNPVLLANKGRFVSRNHLHPEYRLSSSGYDITAEKYSIGKSSSRSSSLQELASIRSCHIHNYRITPALSHSPNSSSSDRLSSTGLLSSNCFVANEFRLPFGNSSLNASSLRPSSFLPCSSTISGSELDNLPSTSISLLFAELKPKISPDDWEPSVPFRPSFFIPSAISSPRSQYDPLRDSFELPKLGDVSFRTFNSQRSSIVDASNRQTFGDSVAQAVGLSPNDDINSVSSRNILSKNVLDKSCHMHEKDVLANEAEALGMSVGSQNKTQPKEENSLDLSDVEDNINMNKTIEHSNSKHHRDGSKQTTNLKVDRVIRQNKEEEVDCIMGEIMNKESKAVRHFRAALIDMVKELLRPKWHEGSLSRDAHNMIVKKTVEKVLSSLQHHQIPTTMESVKQYLSSFRLKISKLVEGYADKYGKT